MASEEIGNDNPTDGNRSHLPSAADHYWTSLPKYIALVDRALDISDRTAGHKGGRRHYWASVLYTRLCVVAESVLHLCPGSQQNADGRFWDFCALAPLIQNLVRCGLMLFYLGTEKVEENESHARLLVMQLRDCSERQRMFSGFDAGRSQREEFRADCDHLRAKLAANPYFKNLPARTRKSLLKGETATIFEEDQILDRLGTFDEKARSLLSFICSCSDLSPLAYYRTGTRGRGTGVENDTDKHYVSISLDVACEIISRSNTDMEGLFQDFLGGGDPQPGKAESGELVHKSTDFILQSEG